MYIAALLARLFNFLFGKRPMSYPVKDSTGTYTGSVVTPDPELEPGVYSFEILSPPPPAPAPGPNAGPPPTDPA